MLTRRSFAATAAASLVAACARPETEISNIPDMRFREPTPPLPEFYGAITDEPYPIPAVPEGVVPERLWRQRVRNPFPNEPEGSIVIDPSAGYLHLIESPEAAMRYGAGTGAQGREWSGNAIVQYTSAWPRWKAPDTLIERQPQFAAYSVSKGGMDPGPGNPLGARALYLYQNGRDTLYRIHGACEPQYLGMEVSSGCIRLLDQDVIDLAKRVRHHAPVKVLPSTARVPLNPVY